MCEPSLTIDRGELAVVDWFARSALPDDLAPYVGSVMARAPAIGGLTGPRAYSHSIVPGGLDVMSSTTRPTGRISLIMRLAICSSRS